MEKWNAIADEVQELRAIGRPVLLGTRTIDHSQILSKLLTDRGIEHQVLNAHHVAVEAEIVAKAGELGKVTVATNMAGRGTDIKLPDAVAALGGLHVICSEIHDSARIDRQLVGRCGRQGDPGSMRQYLSLDDEILVTGLGPKKASRLREDGKKSQGNRKGMGRIFRKAQRKVEAKHLRDRNMLLHHEKQRKKMHRELGQDPYLDTPS
jgi:preprotein translocase subunit SecA